MKGHTTKRGKTWSYVIDVGRDPATGKRRQKWVSKDEHGQPFAREKDAAAAMRRHLSSVEDGTAVEQSTDSLSVFVRDTWLPSKRRAVRPSAFLSLEQCMARVLPRIGALRLKEITPRHIDELYRDLLDSGRRGGESTAGKPLSPRTVSTTGKVLQQCLDDAVKLGLLVRNPAASVERPKVTEKEMRTWTVEEARTFLSSIVGDELEALWKVLLTTGLRRGEALGLRWSDIDFERGTLSVKRALVEVRYAKEWSEPKTAKSRRVVALDPDSVAALKAHRKRQAELKLALGPGYHDDGLIFPKPDGTPLQPQGVTGMFDRLVRKAGVPRITVHGCRHTMATVALAQGVPLKIVSERLGHSTISITGDVYQHVTEHLQEEAATGLGAAFLGSR